MAYGALGAGLGGLFAGVAQARQQRFDDQQRQAELELERQQAADARGYQQQQMDLQRADLAQRQGQYQTELARQGRLDTVAARAQGLNPDGTPLAPLPFTGAAASPQKNGGDLFKSFLFRADQLDAQAQQLQAVGETEPARIARERAQDLRLQAQTYATGTVGLQGTLPVDRARVGLVQAQTAAERDLPQRARQIAAGHDAASLQRATMQVQAAWNRAELSANTRAALANLSASTRMAVAQVAGAYMLTGRNAEDATRAAVAEYQGAVQQNIARMKPYPITDVEPTDLPDVPAPQVTPVQVFVGGQGGYVPGAPGFPGGGAPPSVGTVQAGSNGPTYSPPTVGAANNGLPVSIPSRMNAQQSNVVAGQIVQSVRSGKMTYPQLQYQMYQFVSALAPSVANPDAIQKTANDAADAISRGASPDAVLNTIRKKYGAIGSPTPPPIGAPRTGQPIDQLGLPPVNPRGSNAPSPF